MFDSMLLKHLPEQIELSSAPFDGISSVRFSPSNPSHLLVASWDTVRTISSLRAGVESVRSP